MNNERRPSEKRWNPYLGEWTVIAPVTGVRPWSGTVVAPVKNDQPEFDPECYLCPGVKRAGGWTNPDYKDVYIFTNDFPSLSMDYSDGGGSPFFTSAPARGVCRVVCFTPRHNVTLPGMTVEEITKVIQTLKGEFTALSSIPEIKYVMMFENRGKIIGVSNPHPHGQIYSTDFVPRIPWAQYTNASGFMKDKGRCLFCAVMEEELIAGRRIVCRNNHWVAYVPFFARHTFEVHLVPLRHVPFITELNAEETISFVELYREVLILYDNLFMMPFPNITVFYSAPCGDDNDPSPYHFHLEFYPPLRSPDKLKYMAGFESGGGNIINPSLPEESAKALRSVPAVHYSETL